MNIIKMFMNNVIILLLAVRICEDSDKRGSDKRGYTVSTFLESLQLRFAVRYIPRSEVKTIMYRYVQL